MNIDLKTIQIPQSVYENTVFMLDCLRRNYDETEMECLGFISLEHLEELLDVLLFRDMKETESGVDIPISAYEAQYILHACWDTKNFYSDIGGENTLGLSLIELEAALNDITSVFGRKSEF